MKIKEKVTLAIISIGIILILTLGLVSSTFINRNIQEVEKKKAYSAMENVTGILKQEISRIETSTSDWAYWDETYNFIMDKNSLYINENLDSTSVSNLRIHTILFVNNEGKLVYDKTYSIDYNEEIDTPNVLKDNIYTGSKLLDHKNDHEIISGVVMDGEKPLMVAAVPARNTEGDCSGVLIMGRYLLEENKNWIGDVTDSTIAIKPDLKDNSEANFYQLHNLSINPSEVSSEEASSSAEVLDSNRGHKLKIIVAIPRDIYKQSISNFKIFRGIFLSVFLFVLLVTIILSQKILLERIYTLYEFVKNIKSFEDIKTRLNIKGKDELSSLGNAINLMLNKLQSSNEKVLEKEERLRFVLEGTNEGFWDLSIVTNEIFISSHIAKILEVSDKDILLRIEELKNTLPSSYVRQFTREYIKAVRRNSDDVFIIERNITFNEKKSMWVLIKGRIVVRDENGNALRIAGTFSDITERKKSEDTIKYLSSYDVLTGLYNRAEFGSQLKRLDNKENLPLSLIMCDVNGLKIANDAFGHKTGDKLLLIITSILKKASGKKGIVSRLGGDEFAILLPNTSKKDADGIADKITKYCEEAEADPIKPSIALGRVTKLSEEEDFDKLFDKAEDRMYRNKLLQDKSSRHSIVASLERSLQETDFETREHTARLQKLAVRLGQSIGLSKDNLDELSLLGSLHDIGKIAIPKSILTKPGGLTQEEWEIIKKHSEIGYRIALSSVELIPIADCILTHHEKWNGTGYPKGLKGEEIPLLARIISIVDAYDVITNARPYKKPSTHKEALKEIEKCAGTHFDPTLVKEFINIFEHSDKQLSEKVN
jgi:diguanylate cyclase (GGDEF)-like protein